MIDILAIVTGFSCFSFVVNLYFCFLIFPKGCNTDRNWHFRAEWVHACSWQDQTNRSDVHRTIPCQDGPFEVCRIRPCAMYFTQVKAALAINGPVRTFQFTIKAKQ